MLPGFTAEHSLGKAGANYRAMNAYDHPPGFGAVLPQLLTTVCSTCSHGLARGTRYCCDTEITCNPYGGCTVLQLCHTEDCFFSALDPLWWQ